MADDERLRGERERRSQDLLMHNIENEIRTYSGMAPLDLTERHIVGLASAICSEILYAFDVDWNPDWVRPDDVHSWVNDGSNFARCTVCLLDSPPSASKDDAKAWARAHAAGHAD